jgi:hypothetical protein
MNLAELLRASTGPLVIICATILGWGIVRTNVWEKSSYGLMTVVEILSVLAGAYAVWLGMSKSRPPEEEKK